MLYLVWRSTRCGMLHAVVNWRPGVKTAARSWLVPSERKYSQENKDFLIAQSHDFAETRPLSNVWWTEVHNFLSCVRFALMVYGQIVLEITIDTHIALCTVNPFWRDKIWVFFLSPNLCYLPTVVDVEGYCCISSHSRKYTHTRWESLDEWSACCRDPYLTHTTFTRDIHAPDGIWTRNPSKRAAEDTHALDRATLVLLGRRQHRVDESGRVAVIV